MLNVKRRPKPYIRDQCLMVQVRRLHPNVESLFEQFYRFSSWLQRLEVADFGFFEVYGILRFSIFVNSIWDVGALLGIRGVAGLRQKEVSVVNGSTGVAF